MPADPRRFAEDTSVVKPYPPAPDAPGVRTVTIDGVTVSVWRCPNGALGGVVRLRRGRPGVVTHNTPGVLAWWITRRIGDALPWHAVQDIVARTVDEVVVVPACRRECLSGSPAVARCSGRACPVEEVSHG